MNTFGGNWFPLIWSLLDSFSLSLNGGSGLILGGVSLDVARVFQKHISKEVNFALSEGPSSLLVQHINLWV